jgi:hypothetical protein
MAFIKYHSADIIKKSSPEDQQEMQKFAELSEDKKKKEKAESK